MVLFSIVMACAPEGSPSEVEVTEDVVINALSGWENFTTYTNSIQPSDASQDVWFEVLLNEATIRWMDDANASEDELSIIRPVYDEDDPAAMTALTMMFKVPGSSLETDDWQWAKAEPDGEIIEFGSATTASCSTCHAAVRDTNHWLLEVEL